MKESGSEDPSGIPENYYNEYLTFRGRTKLSVPLQDFYHGRMLSFARRSFPPSPSILEVGFGLGHFAELARKAGIAYSAVDMSEAICTAARAGGFAITHASYPPAPAGVSFNVIWMSHVLEHAKDWHQAREMAEAAFSSLPSPGLFVVICPDILSWKGHFWMDWSHGYATSAPRLLQLMHDVGFEKVQVTYSTSTVTARFPRALLDMFFSCIPVGLIDGILKFVGLRPYCASFMTLFGWRHLIVLSER
jgi:SAM-dependent methyltransferase